MAKKFVEKALLTKEEKFLKNWVKQINFIFLDSEIYYSKDDMTTFILVTKQELKEIKRKTLQRMLMYNRNIKFRCGFTEEDIRKLKEHD